VADEKFYETRLDLVAQFGAIDFNPNPTRGFWVHEGRRYEDELVRLVVDVEDTVENHELFTRFKETLLERFEQIEIYIATYPVDLL
jgi:hypothetical protein